MGNLCVKFKEKDQLVEDDAIQGREIVPDNSGSLEMFQAIYDYESIGDTDISFEAGDKFELMDSRYNDDSWLYVKNLRTSNVGYVPSNYVVSMESNLRYSFYFGDVSRQGANKLLLESEVEEGTFVLRKSQKTPGTYAISVKVDDGTSSGTISHYQVTKSMTGKYCLDDINYFTSLGDLVQYYRINRFGKLLLTKPCQKKKPVLNDISPQTVDKWEIERKKVTLLKCIGKGNFGEVFLGYCHKRTVAVKKIDSTVIHPDDMMKEASIMKKFFHDNVVRLYGVCTKDNPMYIITEFMENGDLKTFLMERDGRTFEFDKLAQIAAEIASGMAYLELGNFIHRDLAARNVLIAGKPEYTAKISDFGLSRHVASEYYKTREGEPIPIKWTAPEVILYQRFTTKSDVWSYGIVLYELFTKGAEPYPGLCNDDVMRELEDRKPYKKPWASLNFPDNIYEILLKCCNYDTEARPTFRFLQDEFENLACVGKDFVYD